MQHVTIKSEAQVSKKVVKKEKNDDKFQPQYEIQSVKVKLKRQEWANLKRVFFFYFCKYVPGLYINSFPLGWEKAELCKNAS